MFSQQLKRYEINMQSVLLRNNDRIRFHEKLKHSPDFDLFIGIVSKSSTFVFQEYLVKYRKLENSLTSKNISIWWSEMKYTIDKIFMDEELLYKYSNSSKFIYAKIFYNKARFLISKGNKRQARKELYPYKFLSIKYFFLYFTTFFPIFIWKFIHKYK